jgi:hypothetical protein
MRGDDAKQYDNIVAYVPEYGGNLAVEAHNISVVSQFEIPFMTPRRHRRLASQMSAMRTLLPFV